VNTAVPAVLTPYQTGTPRPTATLIPPLTTPKLPTTTPIIYTIKMGDTLSAIAARYHVPVEALLTANPGIQAGALVVGKTLIIPTGIQATGVALPTPAEAPITQAHCYPDAAGGAWCFVLLQNPYAEALENPSVQLTLLDPDGQELTSQITYGLLDIIPPGRSMPLTAYFPPPVQADVQVRAQVLTVVRLLAGDQRYMDGAVENTLVALDSSGRTALVSGQVVIHGDQTPASLWVLAVAYDGVGNIVGLRRWEPDEAPTGEEPVRFEFQVFSAGPAIERVEFLAEVKTK
jgi:hypothetical protein